MDNAFVVANYGASTEVLAVIVTTSPDYLFASTEGVIKTDALEWRLRQREGLESANSLALLIRQVCQVITEGSPEWYDVINSQYMINFIANNSVIGMYNESRNLIPLYVYLKDHRADTLTSVIELVEEFGKDHNSENVQFRVTGGSAGIQAATNIVVKKANRIILVLVYALVRLRYFILWGRTASSPGLAFLPSSYSVDMAFYTSL